MDCDKGGARVVLLDDPLTCSIYKLEAMRWWEKVESRYARNSGWKVGKFPPSFPYFLNAKLRFPAHCSISPGPRKVKKQLGPVPSLIIRNCRFQSFPRRRSGHELREGLKTCQPLSQDFREIFVRDRVINILWKNDRREFGS